MHFQASKHLTDQFNTESSVQEWQKMQELEAIKLK